MSDTLIKVENVSKKFCKNLKRSLWYGIKDLGKELSCLPNNGTDQLRKSEFWAVKDISFELKRGACLGLIGPNGAGKTTLLRILNGLIKPDRGRVEMHGRIGALIALGTGFNPLLTGRENIYVNASVLGVTKKEIDAKLDEIVDFAELSDFIDTPLQNYSSGMQVRLGFAVAANLNPNILLIDEVLAVGDLAFRVKCLNHIQKLLKSGISVILVSHDLYHIQAVCTYALLIENGEITVQGKPDHAVSHYEERYGINSIHISNMLDFESFRFIKISILSDGKEISHDSGYFIIETNKNVQIIIVYEIKNKVDIGIQIGLLIKTIDGHNVCGFTTKHFDKFLPGETGSYTLCFEFPQNYLLQGNYYIGLSSFTHDYLHQLSIWQPAVKFRVKTLGLNPLYAIGTVNLPCNVHLIDQPILNKF
jgi:ABC-type polysaccharide/polyol phosphate transport system ATPase subunit